MWMNLFFEGQDYKIIKNLVSVMKLELIGK